MKFWYDTEFLEDGRTIELISIGIVAEDGRLFYAVNGDAPWRRIKKHPWLMANVVPHLPQPHGDWRLHAPKSWVIDFANPAVQKKRAIASAVRAFLTRHDGPVELWGYYSAYDHVVLAQLWGPMIQLPKGLPMWTNDIQQIAAARGLDNSLPAQTGTAHNALDDARWTREAWTYLAGEHPDPSRPIRTTDAQQVLDHALGEPVCRRWRTHNGNEWIDSTPGSDTVQAIDPHTGHRFGAHWGRALIAADYGLTEITAEPTTDTAQEPARADA